MALYEEGLKLALLFYVFLLVMAGACDALQYKIPNKISVALVVVFFLTAGLTYWKTPYPVDLLSHLGAALVVFTAGLPLFFFRVFGAGDIKLLTAVGLWAGFGLLLNVLIYVAILNGVVALLLIGIRRGLFLVMAHPRFPNGITLPRVLTTGEDVPYGIGIAAGSILLAFMDKLPLLSFLVYPSLI